MKARRNLPLLAIVCVCALAAGCGGHDKDDKVADVKGTVTLDGAPLVGASVTFMPQHGSPSFAVTDSSGYYKLTYSTTEKGAEVGNHYVRISTYRAEHRNADGTLIPGAKERLPREYVSGAALLVVVKPGSNRIDFPLKSTGDPSAPKRPPGGGRRGRQFPSAG